MDEITLLPASRRPGPRLGLDQRSEIVELGAGAGQFTLSVARVCARVIAVDAPPARALPQLDPCVKLAMSSTRTV